MITIITILALIGFNLTLLFAWKMYERRQRNIEYEKQLKEQMLHMWLNRIGLQETSYYFNCEGLKMLTLWDLWNIKWM